MPAITVKHLKALIKNVPGQYLVYVNDPGNLQPVTNAQTLVEPLGSGKLLLDIPGKG